MIRVMLADDHHLVRQGICALLEKMGDVEVIAQADNGRQALTLAEQLKPEVMVVDIAMPQLNGIQIAEQIKTMGLNIKVIILSMHADEMLVRQALKYGVRGYLLKRSVSEELALAVRAAVQGEIYLCPAVGAIMADSWQSPALTDEDTAFDRLSPREREVLKLIAEGHTSKSVAQILDLSPKTVEKHRTSLMTRLNTHDLAGLIRVALKHGLIFLEE
jgi:DNA-binding NarL/FixJ family response regulator